MKENLNEKALYAAATEYSVQTSEEEKFEWLAKLYYNIFADIKVFNQVKISITPVEASKLLELEGELENFSFNLSIPLIEGELNGDHIIVPIAQQLGSYEIRAENPNIATSLNLMHDLHQE